jgi:hypothetical protein
MPEHAERPVTCIIGPCVLILIPENDNSVKWNLAPIRRVQTGPHERRFKEDLYINGI